MSHAPHREARPTAVRLRKGRLTAPGTWPSRQRLVAEAPPLSLKRTGASALAEAASPLRPVRPGIGGRGLGLAPWERSRALTPGPSWPRRLHNPGSCLCNRGVLESGTDSFLGYGVQTSPGVWTLTFSTAGLTSGTYTLFAQAKDSYGVLGDPLALTETVS